MQGGEYETTLKGFDVTVTPSPEEGDNFDVYLYEGGNNVYQTTIPLPEDENVAIEEEEFVNYAAQAAIDLYEASRNTLGQGAGATTARKVKAMLRQACVSGKWENWYMSLKGTPYEEQATTLLDQYLSACYAEDLGGELRDAVADEHKILEELDRLNFERMKKADPRQTIIVIGKRAQEHDILYTTELKRGDRVGHYKFGEGTVMGVDASTYSIPIVSVKFDEVEDEIARPGEELKKIGSKTAYFVNVDDIQGYLDGFKGSLLEAQAVAKMKEYLTNQAKIRNLQDSDSDGWRAREDLEAAMEELALQQAQQGVIESAPTTGLESAPAMANDLAELAEGVDLRSPLEPMMAREAKKPGIDNFEIYEGNPGEVPFIAMAIGRDGYHLGDFEDKDDALKAIAEEMEKLDFFPKVYLNDSEGHVTPIDDFYDDPAYVDKPLEPMMATNNLLPKGGRFAKKAFEDVVRDVIECGQWRGDLDPAEVYDKDFPFAVGDKVSLKKDYDDVRHGGIINKLKSGTKGIVDSLWDGHGDCVMVMLEPANLVRLPVDVLKKSGRALKAEKYSVLWGVREGDEDWQEEIISTIPENFDRAKEWASAEGFGRFRISFGDDTEPPNFAKTVRRR